MNLYRARRLRNAIASALAVGATAVGLCWLGMVLGILIWNGLGGLSLRLFVENTPPPGASGGLLNAIVTSLQAISGAGYPGVASWDILGNVIPYIGGGEEEKIETETGKILGHFDGRAVSNHPVAVSASVNRVPVQNGHTTAISVQLDQSPDPAALISAWNCFRGRPQQLELPSAPAQPLVYTTEQNRPQPSLDANRDGGMTVTIGRLRPCAVLGYKFVALGHNTIRGAAGAAILNAELMHREGLL